MGGIFQIVDKVFRNRGQIISDSGVVKKSVNSIPFSVTAGGSFVSLRYAIRVIRHTGLYSVQLHLQAGDPGLPDYPKD